VVNVSNTQEFRAIGVLTTQNPGACQQTFPVVIVLQNSNNQEWFQIALYFVDWSSEDREMLIETFDYETKNTISPWQKIKNFSNGVYLKFAYNRSIRFRMSFVRGGDAVLSAIFFDTYP